MGTYRVAVASSDGQMVDSHFGHADHFFIFEVSEESGDFVHVETRSANAFCSGGTCGSQDEKTDALDGISYVLCARIGPHALQMLERRGIRAYDIVMPVDDALAKVNVFRKKIKGIQ